MEEAKIILELAGAKKTLKFFSANINVDDLDREGVSKVTSNDATSVGASTNNLVSPGSSLTRNHGERRVENFRLKSEVTEQRNMMEDMRRENKKLAEPLVAPRIW